MERPRLLQPPLQFWGVRLTIAFFVMLILACGGDNSMSEGSGYPTTRNVPLVAHNGGTYPVRFKIGPDTTAFGPSVAPSTQAQQLSSDTYTWDSAAHHQNIRVAVGDTYESYEFASALISMTGEQATQGMKIRADWDGETLTLRLISP